MHTTKITRTLALAGFAPAGKPSHTHCGLLSVLALCALTAIALPAQTFTTLLSFDGTDGQNPLYGSLIQATNGDLYGTTAGGGNAGCSEGGFVTGCGTVFKITPSGTLTTLYTFCAQSGCPDGADPVAGLVQATNGDFYGTTASGANSDVACSLYGNPAGCGTVFKITPDGTLTTLHRFCAQTGCTDGANPFAALVQATNGDFYGTTSDGGAAGFGTVFKITPSGTLTTLHTFCSQSGCIDGGYPMAGLIQATNGDLYGTTSYGGANGPYEGTVFKITPGGTLTTVYSFCSQGGSLCTDGEFPQAGLIQATNGDLYGTTYNGGTNCAPAGCGTVFKITPSGALTTLHSFAGNDGANPNGVLAQATNGDFYGTTTDGGPVGYGTVFEITPSGIVTTLYSFCLLGTDPCTDGFPAAAGVVQATNGDLYGTTTDGGINCAPVGCGTVFSLSIGLGPFVETQPTSGAVGAAVKILGSELTGATSVSFNGTAAAFTVASHSLITTTVPAGATSGRVQVVTPHGTLSSNVPFRVLP